MKKIGFLGMGLMGLPMAINIVKKSGQSILGFDVMQEKKDIFKQNGGISVDDPMDIYKTCDIIITCLPTHEIIIDMITKAVENGKAGNIIIDMSSTAPDIVKQLYEKAQEANIHLLDSPISGGEPGAKGGTLAIMTGGEKEIYDEVEPILNYMGFPVYTGASTTGSITKLANNMIAGVYLVGMTEAYAFAAKAGIDPEVLFEATKKGFAGGPLYENKIPKIYNRDFIPGGRIAVHLKDIKNALNFAKTKNIELPATDLVYEVMHWMEENGEINTDQSGMIHYFEKKMNVVVEKHNK